MAAHLLLHLDAPLMSFAAPAVDAYRPTAGFPGLAQLTGLLGNALGYDHGDSDKLAGLQERLVVASARLKAGRELADYQTVDLGQDHLVGTGWTTRGAAEGRKGAHSTGTHQRDRRYIADGAVLVALRLEPAGDSPNLAALAAALDEPARPLFLGRKACLPAGPLHLGQVDAGDLATALAAGAARLAARGQMAAVPEPGERLAAQLPVGADEAPEPVEVELASDRRDWVNQAHGGQRRLRRSTVTVAPEAP